MTTKSKKILRTNCDVTSTETKMPQGLKLMKIMKISVACNTGREKFNYYNLFYFAKCIKVPVFRDEKFQSNLNALRTRAGLANISLIKIL